MIGRIVGVIVGAAIAVTGYGMLKPAPFAKYFDFTKLSLGPFVEYKTLVCWLIVALGVVVALAALQRPSGGGSRKKRSGPVIFAPAEPEPVYAAPAHPEPVPAPAAHDDHGHHEADGHDDHGHDAPAHDDHGHAEYGHDDPKAEHGHHEPEPHGHEPAHAH